MKVTSQANSAIYKKIVESILSTGSWTTSANFQVATEYIPKGKTMLQKEALYFNGECLIVYRHNSMINTTGIQKLAMHQNNSEVP